MPNILNQKKAAKAVISPVRIKIQPIIIYQAYKIIIRDIRPTLRILLQMIFKNVTNNNCRINANPNLRFYPIYNRHFTKNLDKSH